MLMITCGNKAFQWIYKRFTQAPNITINTVGYSESTKQLIAHIKFYTESYRKIRNLDASIATLSIDIPEESRKYKVKIKAKNSHELKIPFMVQSELFQGEAIGSFRMNRSMLLEFSLEWVIHPVILGIVIPEDVSYHMEIDYNKPIIAY